MKTILLLALGCIPGIGAVADTTNCPTDNPMGSTIKPVRCDGDKSTNTYRSFTYDSFKLYPGQSISMPVELHGITCVSADLPCVPHDYNGAYLVFEEGTGHNADVTTLRAYLGPGYASCILWKNNTGKHKNSPHINFQPDGNLVKYDDTGAALWSSKTNGNDNATLNLQADGNLVINNIHGEPIWATMTNGEHYCSGLYEIVPRNTYAENTVNQLAQEAPSLKLGNVTNLGEINK